MKHGIRDIRPGKGQGSCFGTAVGYRRHLTEAPKFFENARGLAVQGIVAWGMVEPIALAIQAQSALQSVGSDVHNAVSKEFLSLHGAKAFETGPASNNAGIEIEMREHVPDLAEAMAEKLSGPSWIDRFEQQAEKATAITF